MRPDMKIGIFYKNENKEINQLIRQEIDRYGFAFDNKKPDVVFSIGGDGTFLRAIHEYLEQLDSVRFIGINNGSLGFLYDFAKEEIPDIFKKLSEGKLNEKEYPLLKGVASYKESKDVIYALNEIRIENPCHTLIADVFVNKDKLETYRGNGLIVSSSLGSSAYNKSLGGALVDPDMFALELTEVAGIQNNAYKSLGSSLIIKGDKVISFEGELTNSVVGYDYLNIQKGDYLEKIEISYSDKKVKIIYSEDHSYIQRVRKSFVL